MGFQKIHGSRGPWGLTAVLQLIYELKKNCCERDGTGGDIEGSTRGPRGPKNIFKLFTNLSHVEEDPSQIVYASLLICMYKAFIIKHMDGLVCVFPTWQKVSRKFKSYFTMSDNCVKTRPIEFQSCQHVTKYENIFFYFALKMRFNSIRLYNF